jgi:hypothetical protein
LGHPGGFETCNGQHHNFLNLVKKTATDIPMVGRGRRGNSGLAGVASTSAEGTAVLDYPENMGYCHAFQAKSSSSGRTRVGQKVLLEGAAKRPAAGKGNANARRREREKNNKIETLRKVTPSMEKAYANSSLKDRELLCRSLSLCRIPSRDDAAMCLGLVPFLKRWRRFVFHFVAKKCGRFLKRWRFFLRDDAALSSALSLTLSAHFVGYFVGCFAASVALDFVGCFAASVAPVPVVCILDLFLHLNDHELVCVSIYSHPYAILYILNML